MDILIVILVLLWLFGYFGHGVYAGLPNLSGNGLIHILLVVAVICLIIRLIRGNIW